MGNISLINNPKKIVPKTYEEWAKIHGNELEYLGEKKNIKKQNKSCKYKKRSKGIFIKYKSTIYRSKRK